MVLVIRIIIKNNNKIIIIIKIIMTIKNKSFDWRNIFKCFKVFKLSAFFNVSVFWFQNEEPTKDKAFWPVFAFQKWHLSLKKLFLKLILPSGANSKTSFK